MALLDDVKTALGIITDDQDVNTTLTLKIEAVKGYLEDAGATLDEPLTPKQASCISIGVNDLLNNKAGGTVFSPAFYTLANQICRG